MRSHWPVMKRSAFTNCGKICEDISAAEQGKWYALKIKLTSQHGLPSASKRNSHVTYYAPVFCYITNKQWKRGSDTGIFTFVSKIGICKLKGVKQRIFLILVSCLLILPLSNVSWSFVIINGIHSESGCATDWSSYRTFQAQTSDHLINLIIGSQNTRV